MKKLYILFLLFSFLSCSSDDDNGNEDCNPEMNIGFFLENSSIAISESDPVHYTIEDGEDIVFIYSFIGAQCDHIADDEYGENVIFQIDPEIEEFSYEDEELSEIKAHFKSVGAWVSRPAISIEDGVISGERLNSTLYHVNIDVSVDLGNDEIREISYEADFQVQTAYL